MARQLLVSIHDVAPETLDRVCRLFDMLARNDLLPVSLLVVPGRQWRERDLRRLAELLAAGGEPAGHGWSHRAEAIRGWKHWLHSLTISRDAAEHLALESGRIRHLMWACHGWFSENGLPTPRLYVPPAWALGDIDPRHLTDLPYDCIETLSGVFIDGGHRFRPLPMVGFEADTPLRAAAVRAWNRLNLARAGGQRPLRLGIHPQDLELRLGQDLERLVAEGGRAISYRELVHQGDGGALP